MTSLISSLKAERRRLIELRRTYRHDAWRKRHFATWIAYLCNQYFSFIFYSIRKRRFKLISNLERVKTGVIDKNFSISSLGNNFTYKNDSALGLAAEGAEKRFWFGSYNFEYADQTPECRDYDSAQVSSWIRDALGEEIRSFIHSDYQITSIRIYETLCIDGAETPNQNSRFHADDLLPGCFRLILYLEEVDSLNGPFLYTSATGEVLSVVGPPGTFVMFKRYVIHAGSSTKKKNRYSMLVNVCSALFPGWEVASDLSIRPPNLMAFKNPFVRFNVSV